MVYRRGHFDERCDGRGGVRLVLDQYRSAAVLPVFGSTTLEVYEVATGLRPGINCCCAARTQRTGAWEAARRVEGRRVASGR